MLIGLKKINMCVWTLCGAKYYKGYGHVLIIETSPNNFEVIGAPPPPLPPPQTHTHAYTGTPTKNHSL